VAIRAAMMERHVTGEHMAKILAFRPEEQRRHESACAAREHGSAEVIVFPGVRYERWNEAGDAEPMRQAATKKRRLDQRRDVLELAE